MRDIESRVPHTLDDGYMTFLKNELVNWSSEDRALFVEESKFALSLYHEYGEKASDADFCKQKVMERFADEEAARVLPPSTRGSKKRAMKRKRKTG